MRTDAFLPSLGRCVKRWGSPSGDPATATAATYYYYDGSNLIQEGPSATAVNRIYVHGNRIDEIVASSGAQGWLYHYYDAQGHCIMLTDAHVAAKEAEAKCRGVKSKHLTFVDSI